MGMDLAAGGHRPRRAQLASLVKPTTLFLTVFDPETELLDFDAILVSPRSKTQTNWQVLQLF